MITTRPLRFLLVALALVTVTSAADAQSVGSTESTELDARVRGALERFYTTVPPARDLASDSRGILVFPRVYKAGFWLGGATGEGALLVGGQTVQYYRTTSLSFGFSFGLQGRTEIVLFMTDDSLAKFRASKGWQAGVDGSIALAEFGTGAGLNTDTVRAPIIGFVFDNKGLMADLSFEGSKYWKITK